MDLRQLFHDYMVHIYKFKLRVGWWYSANSDERQHNAQDKLYVLAGVGRNFFVERVWDLARLKRVFRSDDALDIESRRATKRLRNINESVNWVRATRIGTSDASTPTSQQWDPQVTRRSIITFGHYIRIRQRVCLFVRRKRAMWQLRRSWPEQLNFMSMEALHRALANVTIQHETPTTTAQVNDNVSDAVMEWLPPYVLKQIVYKCVKRNEIDGVLSVASAGGGRARTYHRVTARDNDDAPLQVRSVQRRSRQFHGVLRRSGIDSSRVLASIARRDKELWRDAERLCRRGPLELTKEQTFQLWQRLAECGASAASFNELRAFLRHYAGRRVLLGSSADVARREKASATDFDVKLLSLVDTLGNEKQVVVSLVASLKASIEKEIGELGLEFVRREIDGLDDLVTLVFMIDKGQGWTTALMGYLNQQNPLSARRSSIVGRFAEVPDSYVNLKRALFVPLEEELAPIANDEVGVVRVVSELEGYKAAAALVALDAQESFLWPWCRSLAELPSSLAAVLESQFVAVVVDIFDDAAMGVVTLRKKDTWAEYTVPKVLTWHPIFHKIFDAIAYTPFREKVSYPFHVCLHRVRLFQAGDNALLSTIFGHQGHSSTYFSWANLAKLIDKQARTDGRPILAHAREPQRRFLSDMIENAQKFARGGFTGPACQSITKMPLTPIEPARTARIRA